MIRPNTPIVLLCLAAGAAAAPADLDGPYELQNWTDSGIPDGTTSIDPVSGPATTATFAYSVRLSSAPDGVSERYATFSTRAADDGYVSFDVDWDGFHSWFQAYGRILVFADGPGGREEAVLHADAVWGSFGRSKQDIAIQIHDGYSFGIVVGGSNFDVAGVLEGAVEVSDFHAVQAGDLPPIRFGIDSEDAYQAYLRALFIAETVRADSITDRRPVVFGSLAGLVAYSDLNPHASREQLDAFATAWRTALLAALGANPDDVGAAGLITAMRFLASVESTGPLAGTDTDVGPRAMELLGVSFDQIDATMTDREYRLWQLERAKTLDLTWAPAASDLLVRALFGVAADDEPRPALVGASESLLAGLGIGAPAHGDDAYPGVSALIAALPQTLIAYHVSVANGFASMRGELDASLDRLRLETSESVAQIRDRLGSGSTIEDAWRNNFDQDAVDAEIERRRIKLERLARESAALSFRTMIMELSPNFEDRQVARSYRDFSGVTLQVNQMAEDVNFGLEIAGGVNGLVLGALTKDPVSAIGGLLDLGGSIFNQFGDDTPSPDQQVFDQIIELRQQVEDMRAEMNDRFDRIDAKLNAVFLVLSDGLAQINETTQQIDANVRGLQRQLGDVTSELRSIENRLTSLLQEDRLRDLVAALDESLGFRLRNTIDMSYVGANSFAEFESTFHTWATFEASSEAFSPDPNDQVDPPVTVANADVLLVGNLHERINFLARLRDELVGRPAGSYEYANPVIFAQAADAYAQLADENPWYFARNLGRTGVVMAEGEAVRGFMKALRTNTDAATSPIGKAEQLYLSARDVLYTELYDPANPDARLWAALADLTPHAAVSDWRLPGLPGEYFNLWTYAFDPARPLEFPFFAEAWFDSPIGTLDASFRDVPAAIWAPDLTDAWHLGVDVAASWDVEILGDIDDDGGASDFTVQLSLANPQSGRSDTWTFDVEIFRFDPDNGFRWMTDRSECYEAVEAMLGGSAAIALGSWLLDPSGTPRMLDYSGGGVTYRAEFQGTPRLETSGSGIGAMVNGRRDAILAEIGARFADAVVRPPAGVEAALADMDDASALLNGYLSLAIPETIASNQVVRAALRGDTSSTLAIRAAAVRSSLLASAPPSPATFLARFDAPQLEWSLQRGDSAPDQEHAYLAWALANLERADRDKFRLAVDDTYDAATGGTLSVDRAEGVLANDAEQTTVDERARVFALPAVGQLDLAPDGSFTYDPDPGFVGEVSFQYVAEWVWGDPDLGQVVTSDPASVVLRVSPAPCPADLNADGSLNFFDVSLFLRLFAAGDPAADFNADGSFNFFDVSAFLRAFDAGCP